MASIAIFASGKGSNATEIVSYFSVRDDVRINLIASNNAHAGVLSMAKENGIPSAIFNKQFWNDSPSYILSLMSSYDISHIVLAGFLWLIPSRLISAYPNKIINIHPALLPKYGGKGMYGRNIHDAVCANGDSETGMTIHLVNHKYDEGKIIFQKSIQIEPRTPPNEIAMKVLELEHKYYATIIDKWVNGQL